MSTSAAPVPEASASSNSVRRMIGVIVSPKPTFESIVARPAWILPLIVLMVFGLATTYLYGQHIGWRPFIEKQLEESPRTANLPQDKKNEVIDQQTKYAPIFGYVGAPVVTFGGAAIVAALLLAAFNLLSGAKVGFKTSLAIVAYAWVPGIILQLLGILMIFIKDPSTVDIQNLVASNAGAFVPDGSPKWLVSLGGSLDIFSFWYMALMGIGFSATNPRKITFGKAFGTAFSCWVLWVVVKVGLTAAFS